MSCLLAIITLTLIHWSGVLRHQVSFVLRAGFGSDAGDWEFWKYWWPDSQGRNTQQVLIRNFGTRPTHTKVAFFRNNLRNDSRTMNNERSISSTAPCHADVHWTHDGSQVDAIIESSHSGASDKFFFQMKQQMKLFDDARDWTWQRLDRRTAGERVCYRASVGSRILQSIMSLPFDNSWMNFIHYEIASAVDTNVTFLRAYRSDFFLATCRRNMIGIYKFFTFATIAKRFFLFSRFTFSLSRV